MKCNFVRFKGPRRYRWQCPDYQIIEEPICGEINKMAQVRFSHPTLSCPFLTPCSVNSNFAQLCNSWGHLQHSTCTSWGTLWPQATFVRKHTQAFTEKPLLGAAALRLHWRSAMVMLYEVMLWVHYGYVVVLYGCCYSCYISQREAVLWMPCQPKENECAAVPTAPQVSSSSLLAQALSPGVQQTVWTVRQLAYKRINDTIKLSHNNSNYWHFHIPFYRYSNLNLKDKLYKLFKQEIVFKPDLFSCLCSYMNKRAQFYKIKRIYLQYLFVRY